MTMLLAYQSDRYPILNKIVSAVSWASGVSVHDICGERKPARIATARLVSYYLAVINTGLVDSEIGAFFSKDRGAVVYGHRTIENRLKLRSEAELQGLVMRAQRQLESILAMPDLDGPSVSLHSLLEEAEILISSARTDLTANLPRIARSRLMAVSKLLSESQFMLGELETLTCKAQAYLPNAG